MSVVPSCTYAYQCSKLSKTCAEKMCACMRTTNCISSSGLAIDLIAMDYLHTIFCAQMHIAVLNCVLRLGPGVPMGTIVYKGGSCSSEYLTESAAFPWLEFEHGTYTSSILRIRKCGGMFSAMDSSFQKSSLAIGPLAAKWRLKGNNAKCALEVTNEPQNCSRSRFWCILIICMLQYIESTEINLQWDGP